LEKLNFPLVLGRMASLCPLWRYLPSLSLKGENLSGYSKNGQFSTYRENWLDILPLRFNFYQTHFLVFMSQCCWKGCVRNLRWITYGHFWNDWCLWYYLGWKNQDLFFFFEMPPGGLWRCLCYFFLTKGIFMNYFVNAFSLISRRIILLIKKS